MADNSLDRRERNSESGEMQHPHLNQVLGIGLAMAFAGTADDAHADGPENTLKIGYVLSSTQS